MEICNMIRSALIILLTCSVAQAEATTSYNQKCKVMGDIAQKVMRDRQNGRPLASLVDGLDSVDNKAMQGIMRMVIISAYEQPHYTTKELQDRVVVEFGERILLSCLKAE